MYPTAGRLCAPGPARNGTKTKSYGGMHVDEGTFGKVHAEIRPKELKPFASLNIVDAYSSASWPTTRCPS